MDISSVLKEHYSDFEWSVVNNQYSGLFWSEDNNISKPTESELQTKYNADEYKRQRAAAYPSWQDQLDKIYHDGIDAWKAEIQAIKDQFPKP